MADMSFAQLEDAAGSSNEVTRVTYICQGHEQKSDWGGGQIQDRKKVFVISYMYTIHN